MEQLAHAKIGKTFKKGFYTFFPPKKSNFLKIQSEYKNKTQNIVEEHF